MKYINEEEYESYLENFFKKNGWDVIRQCPADECLGWEHPYTLDLMVRHPEKTKDEWIGLELKNFEGLSKGGKFFQIIKQMKRYSLLTFKCNKIKHWVIAIPQDNLRYQYINSSSNDRTFEFVRMFLTSMGIGIMMNDSCIHFCTNNSRGIVRIDNRYSTSVQPDINFIRKITNKFHDINFTSQIEIKEIKNETICWRCQYILDPEDIYVDNICPYCGRSINKIEDEDDRR